jgi:hypothetical protein
MTRSAALAALVLAGASPALAQSTLILPPPGQGPSSVILPASPSACSTRAAANG